MYFRKISPKTIFLYSEASILPRSLSAALQISFSKPTLAVFMSSILFLQSSHKIGKKSEFIKSYLRNLYRENGNSSKNGSFFTNFCLRILYYIYIKYRIFFAHELKSGKFRKIQLANYKLDIKYTQTKHQTFPTMSHCIKSQQMRYFTGFAFCRDRKKWDISKIPFAPTNNPAERPCCVV